MESIPYWLLFISAAFAINLSPGPDLVYLLSRTVAQGRKIGFASSLGLCSGALVHVSAAALGLSAILAASAFAFSLIKYAGAAYLIYLGIRAFKSNGKRLELKAEKNPQITAWEAYRQGALVDILNPKVAIFFMAFLPQFVRPALGHPSMQILALGVLVILVAVVVEFSFVLAASQITHFLRNNRRCSVWADRVLGSVLIGLGVRLALTESHA